MCAFKVTCSHNNLEIYRRLKESDDDFGDRLLLCFPKTHIFVGGIAV